ncbi:MAG: hypothetical protein N3G76_02935 [Candidatus Micrarchaeota archaeon]|nr:hypothetical protein [Candidatus Micrarchaeota archaeon]
MKKMAKESKQDLCNMQNDMLQAGKKDSKRCGKFARMFSSAAVLLALSSCGDSDAYLVGEDVGSADVKVARDGGSYWYDSGNGRADSGTALDDGGMVSKECEHSTYHVLNVGGKVKSVTEGSSVLIGGKFYVANRAQDGSIVLHSSTEYYVVKDTAVVNGVEVSYLGSGTTLNNTAFLQVEYHDNGAEAKDMILSIGESAKYWVDKSHYVNVALKGAYKAAKKTNGEVQTLEFADVEVELFVQAKEGDGTFISAKKGRYIVYADGAKDIVVDDATGLKVSLDLLGIGTENAVANLSVNGKSVGLKKGGREYTAKINGMPVAVGVISVFCSEENSSAVLLISTPTRSIVHVMKEGERASVEVDDSGQRLSIELLGCEPACKEE